MPVWPMWTMIMTRCAGGCQGWGAATAQGGESRPGRPHGRPAAHDAWADPGLGGCDAPGRGGAAHDEVGADVEGQRGAVEDEVVQRAVAGVAVVEAPDVEGT